MMILFMSLSVHAANYYVNDNSTTNDIFCSAIGSAANNGQTPSTPKATLTSIWDTYGTPGSNTMIAGDTIFVDAGQYYQTDVNLYFDVAIVVSGAGMENTIFDNDDAGAGTGYAFARLGAGVHFENFKIHRYRLDNTYASAIEVEAGVLSVEINYVHVDDCGHTTGKYPIEIGAGADVSFTGGGSSCNNWLQGGGIRVVGAATNVSITDYVFYANSRGYDNGSALRIENGTVTIRNSNFEKNRCNNGGESILYQLDGTLEIYDTQFDGNEYYYAVNEYGGTILVNGGTFYMTKSRITNTTKYVGAGFAYGAGACFDGTASLNVINATIDSCYFASNTGDRGNDLHAQRSNTTVNVNKTIFASAANQVGTRNSAVVNLTNSGSPSLYAGGGTVNNPTPINSNYTASPTVADFTGVCGAVTILPIEFIDFIGGCSEYGKALLNWSTASEKNNDFFTIENSKDGINWNTMQKVYGVGNSQEKSDYNHELNNRTGSYYRLTQTDFDGRSTELKTIYVASCMDDVGVQSAYYSSMDNAINILYNIERNEELTLQLISTSGQQIALSELVLDHNSNEISFQIPDGAATGIYYLNVLCKNANKTFKLCIHN